MWYTWTTLVLVSCALVKAETGEGGPAPAPVATTRAPPRTLDRQAAELAWKSWLQSPESGNQNAPPRRITTKSLFITPLNCPEGQRLDRNGCVQVVTVNKDEHERILLEHLNAWFVTSAPGGGDVLYDYGEAESGPLQLSIPIGSDPQAAPLQGQEPLSQAQDLQPNYVKLDKKDANSPNGDASIEAELELLKLQNSLNPNNTVVDHSYMINQNVLTNYNHPDKPKRDSPIVNETENETINNATDEGQKEIVYGHVNVDPVLYNTENKTITENIEDLVSSSFTDFENKANSLNETQKNSSTMSALQTKLTSNSTNEELKNVGDQSKLNPENDYSDIGEAIKLISRYADVTTDDNYTKEQNNNGMKEDSILGTRTKLQYRRNKPKEQKMESVPFNTPFGLPYNDKTAIHNDYQKYEGYYRYPWQNQHSATPPPDYPFRHLQDYWPGRNQVGGVYNIHENPRRHHHSYPHNFRLHAYPHAGYSAVAQAYPEELKGYIHRVVQNHADPMRAHGNNQDLYSLLGLRHWFSSEGTSKR